MSGGRQEAVGRKPEAGGRMPEAGGRRQAAVVERKPVSAPVGQKLGRNDPCWCGSGKKYKNCHMQKDAR